MRILSWSNITGDEVQRYDSVGAAYALLARTSGDAALGIITIAPLGHLGCHPAAATQAFMVLVGAGHVAGRDGREQPVKEGDVVLWDRGEEHETIADEKMVALVIEADELAFDSLADERRGP
jgi:quercetin dioxygenase-like cupin family protein